MHKYLHGLKEITLIYRIKIYKFDPQYIMYFQEHFTSRTVASVKRHYLKEVSLSLICLY